MVSKINGNGMFCSYTCFPLRGFAPILIRPEMVRTVQLRIDYMRNCEQLMKHIHVNVK